MKIKITPTQIETYSDNSALICFPKNSEYKRFKFWLSNKRVFKTGWFYTIYIDEKGTTTIFKNGNGQWNKFEKISEQKITNKKLIEAFSHQQDSIIEKKHRYH